MQKFSAGEEEAFLHAEACELAVLSKEYVCCAAAGRKPRSVLHTLSVELSVLMGIFPGYFLTLADGVVR